MNQERSPWDDMYDEHPGPLESWLYGERSLNGATRQWIVDQAREWPNGTTLLDAGCGGGVTGYHLKEAGLLGKVAYYGIDGSEAMLRLARRKVGTVDADFSISKLESIEGKYDRVLLRAILAHQEDPQPVLTAACNAIKDDGQLVVIFWNNPVKGDWIYAMTEVGVPDTAHSEQVLTDAIHAAGCVVTRTESIIEPSARNQKTRTIWIIERDAAGMGLPVPEPKAKPKPKRTRKAKPKAK